MHGALFVSFIGIVQFRITMTEPATRNRRKRQARNNFVDVETVSCCTFVYCMHFIRLYSSPIHYKLYIFIVFVYNIYQNQSVLLYS